MTKSYLFKSKRKLKRNPKHKVQNLISSWFSIFTFFMGSSLAPFHKSIININIMYRKKIHTDNNLIRQNYASQRKIKRSKQLSSRYATETTALLEQQTLKFKIQVCIRIRPIIIHKQSDQKVVSIEDKSKIILEDKKNKNSVFSFDRVFSPSDDNQYIHNAMLKGYNSSIFAYGSTGSGKTFTMFGNENHPGLIQLTISDIFRQIQLQMDSTDFIVKMACVQLYNENLYDLLSDFLNQVQLRECPNKGIFLAGATQQMISSEKEVIKLLWKVVNRRQTQTTPSNQCSSRSHAIIQIYVEKKDKAQGFNEQISFSKLSLIDLAGSEKSGTSGNAYESKKINQSLLVLGNCIHELSKNSQRGLKNHIPYRDSKLTRLLKDSLGGNTRTIMISTITPSLSSLDETYNTLQYSSHANKIQLKIHKNIKQVDKSHVANYDRIISQLKMENQKMKQRLGKEYDGKKFDHYKKVLQKGFQREMEIRKQLLEIDNKVGNIEFDQYKTLYMNSKFQKMYQPKENPEYSKFMKQKAILTDQYTLIKEQRDEIIKRLKNTQQNQNGEILDYINQKVIQFQMKQLNNEKIQKSKKTTALQAQKIEVNLLIQQLKQRQKIIKEHKIVLKQKDSKDKDQEWFYSFLDHLDNSVKTPAKLLPRIQPKYENCETEPSYHQPEVPKYYNYLKQQQQRRRSKSIKHRQNNSLLQEPEKPATKDYSQLLDKKVNRYKSYRKRGL